MLQRKTSVSRRVLQQLEIAPNPMCVSQLIMHLNADDLFPNKTTVYRILEKLVKQQLVTEVTLRNGVTYYELLKDTHHHHFVCTDCGTVFCLESCHVELRKINLSELLPNKKFNIHSHDFNLYGLCEDCSK